MNMLKSSKDRLDYAKRYYEKNKAKLKEGMRLYALANKDTIRVKKLALTALNKANGTFRCDLCNSHFTTGQNLQKHRGSKKHRKLLESTAD